MNPDKKGGKEKLEGIEGGTTIIIIYYMKNSIFYKKECNYINNLKKKGEKAINSKQFFSKS